ncbi:GNAT family N-acetyltransferase [Microbacterium resistens]|uniref:GNAT family N-acetyltransferase n=1 Tax=Microbacterium resistens TaxID=156977 RepID=UPI001C59C189|nr:GNAT family N-acetyltransferase [Microbacterium resistens]MBW1641106.1 GNAT family N-acetyltransferase [Microbacterium resistens]
MSLIDAHDVPLDLTSRDRLAASGLEYRIVDLADPAAGRAFARADARGFLDAAPSEESADFMRNALAYRRNVGVFPPAAGPEALPVATVNGWVTPMTVPGGEIPMWAISAVTVSATHRRRGIARNLLEGELRAAAGAGVPLAGLTASEATIYGRYGFAPAVPVARMRIDTRTAGWRAAPAPGRFEYIEKEELATTLSEVHERSRGDRVGNIPGWPGRWERMAGLAPGDDKASSVRAVRYLDEDGAERGVLVFSLSPSSPDAFRFTLSVSHLGAETAEATRALWAFALQHDLVDAVTADLRPLDDPLPWLVVDQRSVEMTVHDHGWLRVLDVPAVLTARTYASPLSLVLGVQDPLGIAGGTWQVVIGDDGVAQVEVTDAEPELQADVETLSALYAGGVAPGALHAAGRLDASPERVAALDAALRTSAAPLLGIWY